MSNLSRHAKPDPQGVGINDGQDSPGASGFSLVELVVVLLVFSVMLMVALPSFKNFGSTQEKTGPKILAAFIRSLRQTAVQENRDIFLCLDSERGRAWAAGQDMEDGEDDLPEPEQGGADGALSELSDLPLEGAELPGQPGEMLQTAVIRLSGRGYADAALIHMKEDEKSVTLKISPFFESVQIIQGAGSYGDCP